MANAKTTAKKAAPKSSSKKVEKKSTSSKVVATTADKGSKKVITAKKREKVVTSSINGVGRRKSSVARVWLSKGKGSIEVNGKKVGTYFSIDQARAEVIKPLVVCRMQDSYNVKINVNGGGVYSQAGASKLGIARALVKINEDFKPMLKEHSLLTVDSRLKERKKPGQRGARRKFQFVKR